MLENLTQAALAAHVGASYRLEPTVQGDPFGVVLSAADASPYADAGAARRAGRRLPFSLLFHAAGGELVPQQICRISGPALDAVELFLVPLGPDGERGMRYEAVIS